jgi:hypothetical protein
VDYLLTLPFYLFFPVPERWTYPDAGAVLLSDLWTSKLIQAFRPFSGLNNCFPSFQVSTTFILEAVFYRCGFAWRTAAVPLAVAVLLSTFALGTHWFPDILAGRPWAGSASGSRSGSCRGSSARSPPSPPSPRNGSGRNQRSAIS